MHTGQYRWLAIMLALACGDDEDARAMPDANLDGGAVDTMLADAAFEASVDASVAYVPPVVQFPSEAPAQPFMLSQVGLYTDIGQKTLAPDLHAYAPTYELWSDGAEKLRWLRLPQGTRIDDTDPDHWQFPVGAVLFKEFRHGERRLETRVVARTGPGERDYFFGAFVWREDESDAQLAWDGASDVRGTQHDVPNVKQCGACHNGEPGRVLGFSAVQTPDAAAWLVHARPAYRVPGDPVASRALGYLHANCGHCHNPSGSARPDTDLMLRLSVAQQSVESSLPYLSSVGVEMQYFQGTPLTLRIAAGDADQSGVYYRMTQRGPRTQMPPFASERVDERGMQQVAAFIATLPHDAGI